MGRLRDDQQEWIPNSIYGAFSAFSARDMQDTRPPRVALNRGQPVQVAYLPLSGARVDMEETCPTFLQTRRRGNTASAWDCRIGTMLEDRSSTLAQKTAKPTGGMAELKRNSARRIGGATTNSNQTEESPSGPGQNQATPPQCKGPLGEICS